MDFLWNYQETKRNLRSLWRSYLFYFISQHHCSTDHLLWNGIFHGSLDGCIKGNSLYLLQCYHYCLVTHKSAEWMPSKIVEKDDSFNAQIIVNILCTVFLMSILLTVVGTWIGTGHISMEPIRMFFHKWPRNFAISFTVEALIAQPISKFVMLKLHQYQERNQSLF